MLVRGEGLPRDRTDIVEILDDLQLFLAGEVVPDVVVVDGPRLAGFLLRLDEDRDRNRGSGAGAENLPAFAPRGLATGPLVAAEVEDINVGKLLLEGGSHSGHGRGVEPAAVRDERHDSLVTHAVGRPTERLDVRVVQGALEGGS